MGPSVRQAASRFGRIVLGVPEAEPSRIGLADYFSVDTFKVWRSATIPKKTNETLKSVIFPSKGQAISISEAL
jgi:hypothetical protein